MSEETPPPPSPVAAEPAKEIAETVERLDARLRRGAVELDEVVAIARLLATHLDALHRAERVDGSIAPTRIAMRSRTESPNVPPIVTPTLEPDVEGPQRAYVAPEVWGIDATPASDQFAMAAILYEALCGGRAFPGDDSEKIRISMSTGRRVPLAARVPGLVEAIDVVFERALAVDPEERFASCGEFANALIEAIDHSRVLPSSALVQKPSSRPQSGRPPSMPPGLDPAGGWSWRSIAVMLLVVIVLAAMAAWVTRG